MACCRIEAPTDAGYATAAALAVSLAVALLAAALVMRGVAVLKLARADFRRSQAEYALSGAQVLAATRLLNGSGPGRLAWSLGGLDPQGVDVLAEPEAPKAGLASVGDLDDGGLRALGAIDVDEARRRILALDTSTATPDQVEAAVAQDVWRACAASALSPWGMADAVSLGGTREPDQEPGGARAGQVWRVRVSTRDGWTDERIVRLKARAESPSAVIWRRFGRGGREGVTCNKTIEARAIGAGEPRGTPATP